MSGSAESILLVVFILAVSVWVGGCIAIAVVARTATATLDADARVSFFRSLGRNFFWLGCPALVIALATGGVLARDLPWDGVLISTALIAAALLTTFGLAVGQARRMTRLRRQLLQSPDDDELRARVTKGARGAGILRALLGVLSLALVVLGAVLAT